MAEGAVGPELHYRAALADAERSETAETARFARLGLIRLAVFFVAVGAAVGVVVQRGGIGGLVLTGAAALFVVLVIWHERVSRRLAVARRSAAYYRRGLARLDGTWRDGGDSGDRFRDDDHLYASDLELFGPGSLFQFLSTAATETGAVTLARWLAVPADGSAVVARQVAVRELADKAAFRHDLAVAGAEIKTALDSASLRAWLEAAPMPVPAGAAPAAGVLAVANVATLLAAGYQLVPGYVAAASLAASFLFSQWLRPRVRHALQTADRPVRELVRLAALLRRAESERFQAPLLTELARAWGATADADAALPSVQIGRVKRFTDLADARANQLFAPVAALLLLGTQLGLAVERWRTRVGGQASRWLDAIGELEALASFATFAFERPDAVDPVIGSAGGKLELRGIAHPLLPSARAVANDLSLGDPCRLVVVSGSNMSGKSTLLKTIGVNLVLGYAGAPVVATSFDAGRFTLGASLVLRESLLEGRSRFYAEILRLKEIVARSERGEPVLFLLDELLSGTNSHDRAQGARAILDGLVARGAIGLVTTHDLALAAIADQLGPKGANWHLEDRLVDGTLEFDYRLKPGVVRNSNAIALMRAVGLAVD